MPDSLSVRKRSLTGNYDCATNSFDAFFRMGHTAGGFRVWWRTLTGSEETLDNTHLMRMAGRFSRRVHGYAKAECIPLVHCQAGQHKHELAEEYLAKTPIRQGVFLILVGRAQAPVWDVTTNHHHIEPKRPMPYVNHYSFHILDREWGHITIKISGHPPFPVSGSYLTICPVFLELFPCGYFYTWLRKTVGSVTPASLMSLATSADGSGILRHLVLSASTTSTVQRVLSFLSPS